MEKDCLHPILEFDSRTTTRHLKMLKAALPYLPIPNKRMLYIYIKFSELMYTIELFKKPQTFFPVCTYPKADCPWDDAPCTNPDIGAGTQTKPDYQQLFHILTELGDDKEKQVFSQISNMMNAFTMYEAYAPLIKAMMEAGDGGMDTTGSDGTGDGGTDNSGMGFGGMGSMFENMGMDSSLIRMLRGMSAASNSNSDAATDSGSDRSSTDTSSNNAASGIQTDMLQSLLSPEQQELFKNFQETI